MSKETHRLTLLTSKKEAYFKRVQLCYDLTKSLNSEKNIHAFRIRCQGIKETRKEFVDILDEINLLGLSITPTVSPSYDSLNALDDLIQVIMESLENLDKLSDSGNSDTHTSKKTSSPLQSPITASHVLPKIDIPTFSGELSKWTPFYNVFCSLVDTSPSLTKVQKLLYLISSLKDEPLNLIKHLPTTHANYSVALDILVKRYQCTRNLANFHLEKLFNLESLPNGSYHKIRSFHDVIVENYAALEALKLPNIGEYVLFQLAFRNLDTMSRKSFETYFAEKSTSTDAKTPEPIPTFKDLMSFLQNHCKILETANFDTSSGTSSKNKYKPKQYTEVKRTHVATSASGGQRTSNPPRVPSRINTYKSSASTSTPTEKSVNTISTMKSNKPFITECVVCKDQHTIYKCPQILNLNPKQRMQKIISLGRCSNCFGNHPQAMCKSTSRCFQCGLDHHTLLHKTDNCSSRENPQTSINLSSQQTCAASHLPTSSVLLSTAVIHVRDSVGGFLEARVLIDSGAQSSFLSSSFFSRLGLPLRKSDVSVSGVGNTPAIRPKGVTYISIKPRISLQPVLTTEVVVMDNLTGKLPSSPVAPDVKDKFADLILADPNFTTPSHIDGIIGAELFPYIFSGSTRSGGANQPTAMSSIFGWVIIGTVSPSQSISVFTAAVSIEETLRSFWEVEQPPSILPQDPEDLEAESIFSSQHQRDEYGRYFVPLLLRNDPNISLGGSFGFAVKSLLSLERRFKRNPELKEDYCNFMREYIDLGHMRALQDGDSAAAYYIPHHAVVNPSSTSTKLRVVFNGSAKSNSGFSLNDKLYIGPKLQNEISVIILKFRCHQIVFTADICKMFRQVGILFKDTKYQRILWRFSPEEPVTEYILLTVTYGLRSAPYLAGRSLHQLAVDEGASLPRAAQVLTRECYVDDLMTGADSIQDALQLQSDVSTLLSKGGFKLRKWSSNHSALLSNVPTEDRQTPLIFNTDEAPSVKVLGLQWCPQSDTFGYIISAVTPQYTKRSLLSDISKLFDPMGWLSPVVFLAKYFIQRLWLCGAGWDDEIPEDIKHAWERFISQLPLLSNISLPRLVLPQTPTELSLVVFSDASEKGYAAVAYLHAYHHASNTSKISLLMGKSRVAPLKTVTVPRLELCGAVLAARVLNFLRSSLPPSIDINHTLAFSDSSTVLGWIRTPPHLLKTFVSNRVVQILDVLSPSNWYHVPTAENPADCASRGLLPKSLLEHPLWFTGPPWLSKPFDQWPLNLLATSVSKLPDLRPEKEFLVATTQCKQLKVQECNELITRFSSFSKLKRFTAWALRLSRSHNSGQRGRLTTIEVEAALLRLVTLEQFIHFQDDILSLKLGGHPSSSLRSLNPFLDSVGVVRVGGRLRHADMAYDARHPILLPKKCALTNLIIDYFHLKYFHVGPRTLQSFIVRSFWIISARQAIRSRLSKCLPCLKMRTTHIQPQMSNLPLSRVRQARPFLVVGTDFGGPFIMKESHLRKSRTSKVYLCLFVCFVTKAVHLEIVSSLSTEAFLAAFERFISRRGKCTDVYSDCGTNYVGASRYFSELHRYFNNLSHKDKVIKHLADLQINWHFSPPSAPHFGGLWEAGIKSAKHLMKKVIGERPLTFEEYSTFFCKVEAILNSRPLCSNSIDPHELDVLTPGHFLVGAPLTAPVERDITEVSQNRLKRWELLRHASQTFWHRWQQEYIHTLTQRHKWTKNQPNLQVNDLVLVNVGRSPPFCWKVGRVTAVHPGQDNKVRVVTVRTAQGEFRRPVVKLALLPNQ